MVDLGPVDPGDIPQELTDEDLAWINEQRALAGQPETWRGVSIEPNPRLSVRILR